MSTIVMKFGGTSVADLNIMRNAILKIVEEETLLALEKKKKTNYDEPSPPYNPKEWD